MKILTRYILSSYLKILGLCVSSFVTIYLVIDFLEKINRFTRSHGKPQYIALYFLCKIPEIVVQIIPLGILMTTLLTLGLLSRNSEITAMRGCGISLRKITTPILAVALLASILSFFASELLITNTSRQLKYIEDVLIAGKSPSTFFRQDNIWYKEENSILQARLFNPDTKTLEGVTFWQTTSGMQPVRQIEADKCVWDNNQWELKNPLVRTMANGSIVQTSKLAVMPIPLKLKLDDLKVLDKHADTIGFFKLRKYCENLRRSGYDPTRYLAEMHAKVSLPFTSFIMAFLGIPFAMRSGRSSGIAVGIGLSLAIGLAYYIINATIFSFGQTGVLPPFIAAWAANFIFALTGIWLTMTVND